MPMQARGKARVNAASLDTVLQDHRDDDALTAKS